MIAAIIADLTCAGLIASVLFKPAVKMRGININLYWVDAMLGAILLLLFGAISPEAVISGLFSDSAMNPVKIVTLFISMTMLSIYLDEIGFFRKLASSILAKAHASQPRLFLYLYVLVSVLTVFTSNDIIILTFTPFICYFSANAKINPLPYLFAEFVAANTWSMMLIIGNPTNIYIATAYNIGFAEYISVMLLPTVMAGSVALLMLYVIFRKQLRKAPEITGAENITINRPRMLIGIGHLAVCTICLIASSYIGIEMWIVSLVACISLIIANSVYSFFSKTGYREIGTTLKRAPWELIPFVISMFVIVLALNESGITSSLATYAGDSHVIAKYGILSCLAANIVNNIPMSVLFSSIIGNIDTAATSNVREMAAYAAIVGSNIGAFLTPIGALAGIMWTRILRNQSVQVDFKTFVKYGAAIAVPALSAALIGLSIIY